MILNYRVWLLDSKKQVTIGWQFGFNNVLKITSSNCIFGDKKKIKERKKGQVKVIYYFIALIHPIQWTIALPVGATGPAKRQKKTSCIYYRQDRSQSVHSPGGASYFISCLPIDVIASFSFGAKECAEDFLQRYVFEVLQRTLPSFLFFISTE